MLQKNRHAGSCVDWTCCSLDTCLTPPSPTCYPSPTVSEDPAV